MWVTDNERVAPKLAHWLRVLSKIISAHMPVLTMSLLQKFSLIPSFSNSLSKNYAVWSVPVAPKNVTFPSMPLCFNRVFAALAVLIPAPPGRALRPFISQILSNRGIALGLAKVFLPIYRSYSFKRLSSCTSTERSSNGLPIMKILLLSHRGVPGLKNLIGWYVIGVS